jgi:hypothetical protein
MTGQGSWREEANEAGAKLRYWIQDRSVPKDMK